MTEAKGILVHIPHSSTVIPPECRPLFQKKVDLGTELLRMTDRYTEDLFGDVPGEKLVFPYSRLVCDVERFRDDEKEEMAARGMGVCYESTSELTILKTVTKSHKEKMLALYDAHHKSLEKAVEKALREAGRCLIFDCHSFSTKRLPYENLPKGKEERPEICIGTDAFHTPSWLSELLITAFTEAGYRVAVNTPFSGTMVPEKYYRKNPELFSAMIEVRRGLYMDEGTGKKNSGYEKLKKDLTEITERVCEKFGLLLPGPHTCPVCGRYRFRERASDAVCPVCGWKDDPVQEFYPEEDRCENALSLKEYRKSFAAVNRKARAVTGTDFLSVSPAEKTERGILCRQLKPYEKEFTEGMAEIMETMELLSFDRHLWRRK